MRLDRRISRLESQAPEATESRESILARLQDRLAGIRARLEPVEMSPEESGEAMARLRGRLAALR